MADFTDLHVRVRAITPSDELEPNDTEVAGAYLVHTAKGCLSPGKAVACALDVFHEENGIDCLDDFVITVMDPTSYQILAEADGHENGSTTNLEARYGGKIDSDLEGTEFGVRVIAVGDDGGRTTLGDVRVVACNVSQAQQRAFDLLWDHRLDSASCSAAYQTTHDDEGISAGAGDLFWWADADGRHRAQSTEHEFLVFEKVGAGRDDRYQSVIDDRHEASFGTIKKAKQFCQDVHSGKLAKKPITAMRP